MLTEFFRYIRDRQLFREKDRVLLAVSGGRDSVVMSLLFHRAGFSFGIAHCNFGLRGSESDEDEAFVKNLAAGLDVPFYSKRFNTASVSAKEKNSIQMAARELRYKWFHELAGKKKYAFVATAHHRDDAVETFFINLLRGSGVAGLRGIQARQGNIIRPLLFATRAQITSFAKNQKMKYRDDSSNLSDVYLRNKLRLDILPLLRKINPSLDNTIIETAERMSETYDFILHVLGQKSASLVHREKNRTLISIRTLKKEGSVKFLLHCLLAPFQFTEDTVNNISKSISSQPGKIFYSPGYRLIKDREHLIITEKSENDRRLKKGTKKEEFGIQSGTSVIRTPLTLSFSVKRNTAGFRMLKSPMTAFLDYDKLQFPLFLRKWQKGDVFYPFGMKMKRKKLSDFFTDEKVSRYDKENAWLLISGKDIAWVVGMRTDERYRISSSTKRILVCMLKE